MHWRGGHSRACVSGIKIWDSGALEPSKSPLLLAKPTPVGLSGTGNLELLSEKINSHSRGINSVAFSTDGTKIVTACYGGTIKVLVYIHSCIIYSIKRVTAKKVVLFGRPLLASSRTLLSGPNCGEDARPCDYRRRGVDGRRAGGAGACRDAAVVRPSQRGRGMRAAAELF
jgi:hypothetical protein